MVNGRASGGEKTNVPGHWRQQPAFMMRAQDTAFIQTPGQAWEWDPYNWMMVTIDDDQTLPLIQTLLHPTSTTQGVRDDDDALLVTIHAMLPWQPLSQGGATPHTPHNWTWQMDTL